MVEVTGAGDAPDDAGDARPRILYVEPFDGGSHRLFTRALTERLDARWSILTLPARHWKWRVRGAVPYFALHDGDVLARDHDLVIASSYVPLAELRGLAPRLARTPAVLYFHENQLAYPVREARERDLHFGFSQLVSALAADRCVFNSAHNRDSFLDAAAELLERMPDFAPPGWVDAVRERSAVLPVPLLLDPSVAGGGGGRSDSGPAIVLWNHRWEYDKNPEAFFAALRQLDHRGVPFRVIVTGQRFRKAPPCFDEARAWLGDRVVHWGFVPDRDDYLALLARADIAVSTADHEFFGVAMLEAAHYGATPLVPDRLAYPETFPEPFRYGTDAELIDRMEALCLGTVAGSLTPRADRRDITAPYGRPLLERYAALVQEMTGRAVEVVDRC